MVTSHAMPFFHVHPSLFLSWDNPSPTIGMLPLTRIERLAVMLSFPVTIVQDAPSTILMCGHLTAVPSLSFRGGLIAYFF